LPNPRPLDKRPLDKNYKEIKEREINLNLDSLYFEVKENIDRVRFDELWQGFAPFKFALYDAEKCFFNGGFMKKPATCKFRVKSLNLTCI